MKLRISFKTDPELLKCKNRITGILYCEGVFNEIIIAVIHPSLFKMAVFM